MSHVLYKPPANCPGCGRRWGPGKFHLSWRSCDCPGAQHGGHHVIYCEYDDCGFTMADGHQEQDIDNDK